MTSPTRVLLIEDNRLDQRLIGDMLSEAQAHAFEITFAGTLTEGLEKLDDGSIDIILLDLNLPDSEGLTTLHTVVSRHPFAPIVICSATTDEETAALAVEEGAQDYLIKGRIDPDRLVRAIRYAALRKRGRGLPESGPRRAGKTGP